MTDATRVCGWRPVCDSSSSLRRQTMRRRSRMSKDDVLFGYRLRLFALAGEIGVRPACRAMGVHHSTYYRWAEKVERWGLEALRPRERRRPRMPNQLGPHLEQRIVAVRARPAGVRSQADQRPAGAGAGGRAGELPERDPRASST